jgi:hypothetical protein
MTEKDPKAIAWPATRDSMLDAGYAFLKTDFCRSCQKAVEFWLTPKGHRAPFVVDGNNLRTSHFADCPQAAEHRRKK